MYRYQSCINLHLNISGRESVKNVLLLALHMYISIRFLLRIYIFLSFRYCITRVLKFLMLRQLSNQFK